MEVATAGGRGTIIQIPGLKKMVCCVQFCLCGIFLTLRKVRASLLNGKCLVKASMKRKYGLADRNIRLKPHLYPVSCSHNPLTLSCDLIPSL